MPQKNAKKNLAGYINELDKHGKTIGTRVFSSNLDFLQGFPMFSYVFQRINVMLHETGSNVTVKVAFTRQLPHLNTVLNGTVLLGNIKLH